MNLDLDLYEGRPCSPRATKSNKAWTRDQLLDRARALGLTGYSNMTKAQLCKLLRSQQLPASTQPSQAPLPVMRTILPPPIQPLQPLQPLPVTQTILPPPIQPLQPLQPLPEPFPLQQLDQLPLMNVALQLNIDDLMKFCQTNKRFRDICRNQTFWMKKIETDFGLRYPAQPGFDFHRLYFDLFPKLYTFGFNYYGQLGLRDNINRNIAILVPTLNNVTAVSCGGWHTAVIANGQLYTFGSNDKGQLGLGDNGPNTNRNVPTLVPGLINVTAVSCGDRHTAVITNGQLYTFGYNDFGRLGLGDNGPNTNRNVPTLVPDLNNVTAVSCGDHTAVIDNGQLYTFGYNDFGQLGLGDNVNRNIPTLVPGLINITSVACSENYTVVITSTGQLYTFGSNGQGRLGLGDEINRDVPTLVPGLINVLAVSCSGNHTAVIASQR